MRDSKDPDGPVLTFTPAEWEAFTLGVQDGEFDVEDDSPEDHKAGESASDNTGPDRAGQLPVRPATPAGIRTVLGTDLGEPDGINIAEELARFRADER
jgi:hypothetical protein